VQTQPETTPSDHLIDELRSGSSVALVKSTRMITKLLVEYRAYDFLDSWEGLVEGVLGQLLSVPWIATEEFEARLHRTTLDDLSAHLRTQTDWQDDGELPWCESSRMSEAKIPDIAQAVAQYEVEIGKLQEQRSQVVADVYGNGRSFDQVAAERKLPLRMVKRFLRETIWDLRERCAVPGRLDRADAEHRVKSCLKSLELDLPAFLVEPHLEEWREFRTHYPVCQDCSLVVSNWSGVESMVREACGGTHRHPSADDLIALHRDGEGLAYSQYVSLMRHLDGCPPCSEAMTLLARYDRRPIGELLMKQARNGRRAVARGSAVRRWLGRMLARL
jgi:hypothetical protein